jgi:hypothetical protein
VIACDTEALAPIRDYKTGLCKLCNMNEAGLLIVKTTNVGKSKSQIHSKAETLDWVPSCTHA